MKFDTIIVGGGSAGAILAARLSEDTNRSILLLEAGPDYDSADETPEDIRNALTVSVTKHDWGYDAEAVPGRRMDYARGKAIGGCSSVNGCIALRAVPTDLEEWASWGNDEWTWEKSLPYFLKIENDLEFGDKDYHGSEGPTPITRFKEDELVPLQKAYLDACKERFPYVDDHNDPESTGVGPIPMNRSGNLRISTALGHLAQARGRENLTIRGNALVDRILFEGNKAVGVAIVSGGGIEAIYGENIVLSAGAVNSPTVLMRSGVGPRADLEALGIEVVLDQPNVGQHMIEHQQITVGVIPKAGVTHVDDPDVQIIVRYTNPGTTEFNNMQIYFVSRYVPESHRPISVMNVLQKPKSRGSVRLKSAHPSLPPEIVLNSYGHPDDEKIARDGVRTCWDIANSPQIQAQCEGLADSLTQEMVDDDDKLMEYIREHSGTIWHPVGTCRMGPAGDATAVVDQYCRVHGLENLRVVDGSVFPNHVSGNPNLTIYVIAERVADWMKQA